MAPLDRPDLQGHRGQLDFKVHREPKGQQGLLGNLARRDLLDHKAWRDRQVNRGHRVRKGSRGMMGAQGRRELQD